MQNKIKDLANAVKLTWQKSNKPWQDNISSEKILDLVYRYTPIPDSKVLITEKMITDAALVYEALMPLYKVDIYFGMHIVGGSIRDLVLDNEHKIKDLDFLIHISSAHQEKILNGEYIKKVLKLPKRQFKWNTPIDDKNKQHEIQTRLFQCISYLIKQKLNITEEYAPFNVEDKKDDYLERSLQGVIKVSDSKLNYPVDILITNIPATRYIEKFDFGICKTGVRLICGTTSMMHVFDFPDNAKQFFNNIVFDNHFFNDVESKSVSINLDNRSLKDVQRSIDEHLPRIIAKYPDYTVKWQHTCDQSEDKSMTAKLAFLDAWQLNKILPITTTKIIKRTKI